jgi:hypothetical protein
VNVALPHRGLIFYKTTKYPCVLLVSGIGYGDPTMFIAITPWKGSLKDDNTLRLVNAFMKNRNTFSGERLCINFRNKGCNSLHAGDGSMHHRS